MKKSKNPKTPESPLFSQSFVEGELPEVASRLLEIIRSLRTRPIVVLLNGPMGAGKSTLVRACLAAAQSVGDFKGSPTFSLAHEYDSPLGRFIHIDWYRIEHEEELEAMGMREYLSGDACAVFIEWADQFPGWCKGLPSSLRVNLAVLSPDSRQITVFSGV